VASSPQVSSGNSCPADFKWCKGCQKCLPVMWFKGSRCPKCTLKRNRQQALLAKFGITLDEYDALLAAQGGRCAICSSSPKTQRYAVDHDHQTGKVRGILCMRCNHKLLGGARDKIELLVRAIKYLQSPPAVATLGTRLVPVKIKKPKVSGPKLASLGIT